MPQSRRDLTVEHNIVLSERGHSVVVTTPRGVVYVDVSGQYRQVEVQILPTGKNEVYQDKPINKSGITLKLERRDGKEE